MKITVDLEDFFLGEDESIQEGLKRSIINECVLQIKDYLKDRIAIEITAKVKEIVNEHLSNQLSEVVADCIANHKIKGRYHGDPEMTIQEYVHKQFYDESSKKAPTHEYIEKEAKKLGDEIKKRYDMSFAAGIVQKMHENNLLKDENLSKLLQS